MKRKKRGEKEENKTRNKEEKTLLLTLKQPATPSVFTILTNPCQTPV